VTKRDIFASGFTELQQIMCGIAAILGEKGCQNASRVRSAIEILRHRGPNGVGYWQSQDGRVSLSHARLSTIDLLGGHQPITNEDGTVVAAVNGEFYEWKTIRAQLEGLGHRFRTSTDSEILVHLYEHCGVDCLEQLQGEFAFVLWDERRQILFAARDRFGAKPLYYCHGKEETLIASEVKALQRAGVALAWDEQGFLEKFVFQSCLRGRTLYRGIYELPAGHFLLQEGSSSKVGQYWDLDYAKEEIHPVQSDDCYAAELQELMNAAVKKRMQADVPAACYLSGGIDSSGILGLMSRHAVTPISAFCISFDNPEFDEFDVAARCAGHFGAHLQKVPVTSSTLAEDFPQTVWHCESLINNANAVAKYALSRAVHEAEFRVVLSGEGADELFAGYGHLVADALRGQSSEEREEFQHILRVKAERLESILYPSGRSSSGVVFDRLGYVPISTDARHRLLAHFHPVFSNALSESGLDILLLDSLDVKGRMQGRSALNQSLYLHAKTVFSGVTLSVLGDRVEMAHSVESRLPFLDEHVVQFARRAPSSQKVRNGVEKFVLRKAMRSVVSPEICGRRKQPLRAPPALWEPASALGQLLQDTLRSQSLESIPFLNKGAIRKLLDDASTEAPMIRGGLEGPMTSLASACVLAETLFVS
jgi:asparagine synthase (glutamine-hydrolysing)